MPTTSTEQAMPQDLTGNTAVITGAASGIGKAIALRLAGRGANVLLHTRVNKKGLETVAKEIETAGGNAKCYYADFRDAQAAIKLVQQMWNESAIDFWVHNAGADVLTGESAGDEFSAKLEQLWKVDVLATITACRTVGERMRQRGSGAILTMGWDQAAHGMEGDSGQMFSVTKGAVMAFSKSLAKSLAPKVRVNCIAPGWIQTKWGDDAPDYWQKRAESESMLARWGQPEDIAGAAAFLCSAEAAFITGQVLNVNGGFNGAGHKSVADDGAVE